MELEVSYLFVKNNLSLTGDANSHVAGEASWVRMGPQAARRSTGGFPRGLCNS